MSAGSDSVEFHVVVSTFDTGSRPGSLLLNLPAINSNQAGSKLPR